MSVVRTDAWKEEIALALLLWRDFKCDGKFDTDVIVQALIMANLLGVKEEYDKLMAQLPPLKIVPR